MIKYYTRKDVTAVVDELKKGHVVAFPTDTVYGLGVQYFDEDALQALKEMKGRPENKPIPTMVGSMSQIDEIANVTPFARELMHTFMPGAFTIILKKKEHVDSFHTNGFDTIGIRMPDDKFILDMIQKLGKPMLVSSANVSGGENTFTSEEVKQQLIERLDILVEGVALGSSASTIVDATKHPVVIVREGPISAEDIIHLEKKFYKDMV